MYVGVGVGERDLPDQLFPVDNGGTIRPNHAANVDGDHVVRGDKMLFQPTTRCRLYPELAGTLQLFPTSTLKCFSKCVYIIQRSFYVSSPLFSWAGFEKPYEKKASSLSEVNAEGFSPLRGLGLGG